MTNLDRIPDKFVFTDSNDDYMFLDELFDICNRHRIYFKTVNQMTKYFRITLKLKDTRHFHPISKCRRVALRKIKPNADDMYKLHERPMTMQEVKRYLDMYLKPNTWTKLATLKNMIMLNHKVTLPSSKSITEWIRYNNIYDSSVELGLRITS